MLFFRVVVNRTDAWASDRNLEEGLATELATMLFCGFGVKFRYDRKTNRGSFFARLRSNEEKLLLTLRIKIARILS